MIRVCVYSKCGRSFNGPVELAVWKDGFLIETYNACPRCFSRVSDEGTERQLAPVQMMEIQIEQATLEVLRNLDVFSDTEGRHIFELARMYVRN